MEKKDLGQLHLCRPSFDCSKSKRATLSGISPNLVKMEAKVTYFMTTFSNTHISDLEFCKILKASDHQFGIGWPYKKDPGQLHLREPSYGCSKSMRAILSAISPNLVKIACLCENTWFSGLKWSFKKVQNLEPLDGSALAIEQGPRRVASLEGKLHPVKVGNCQRIFTYFVKMTISLA